MREEGEDKALKIDKAGKTKEEGHLAKMSKGGEPGCESKQRQEQAAK